MRNNRWLKVRWFGAGAALTALAASLLGAAGRPSGEPAKGGPPALPQGRPITAAPAKDGKLRVIVRAGASTRD